MEGAMDAGNDCNALIMPGKKKKNKSKNDKKPKPKLDRRGRVIPAKPQISKKKLKKLQKIVDNKAKRANRSAILEELSKLQTPQEILEQLTSVAKMQTKEPKKSTKLNSLCGSKRKRKNSDSSTDGPVEITSIKRDRRGNIITGVYVETDSSTDDDDQDHKDSSIKQEIVAPIDDVADTFIEEAEVEICEEKVKTKPVEREAVLPTVNIPVYRSEAIQAARLKLPICAEEQPIIEAIKENQVVILCGETGSGKTTQVPQFLYEAGFAENGRMIGVTEPRRVAAISMANRVATEMNLPSDRVSYQIRYEGNSTAQTQIKFMTDGVLMQELRTDIQLKKYSVIIIDEAHERSVYSDILIGLLSRIAPMRTRKGDPLKLVIMSATLRVDDFMTPNLFKTEPKVLKVESRQFPVTTYFSKRTKHNYLLECFKKIDKIHRQLPDGGILVFVSGQKEVLTLVSWLKQAFPSQSKGGEKISKKKRKKRPKIAKCLDLDSYKVGENMEYERVEEVPSEKLEKQVEAPDLDEIGASGELELFEDDELMDAPHLQEYMDKHQSPMHVLPLYSLLPTAKQSLVFDPPPMGSRLCVVATNVAETSLTIPGIKYMVDSGKHKVRMYDPVTGVSRFEVQWISKASAEQRAGRAGRTGPGHCYRLYSGAVFTDFDQFPVPDIINKPVDELVMQMKAMNIVKVNNFPFPTPPERNALKAAEDRLVRLGALEVNCKGKDKEARITSLGRTMAIFAVKPQFAKILALADQKGLLPYAICLTAALSVREPLINLSSIKAETLEETKEKVLKIIKLRRQWAFEGNSLWLGDLSILIRAVGATEYQGCWLVPCQFFHNLNKKDEKVSQTFKKCLSQKLCDEYGLSYKAMIEIRKLRRQLTKLINVLFDRKGAEVLVVDAKMPPPNDTQARMLRQLVLSGLAQNVAKKLPLDTEADADTKKQMKAAYQTQIIVDPVFMHPTCALYKELPEYVLYQEIVEMGGEKSKKYMQTVCSVEEQWFPIFASNWCSFGEPLKDTKPRYDIIKDCILMTYPCTFGALGWTLPNTERMPAVDLMYYRIFACELLSGHVVEGLAKFKQRLLASPSVMLKNWAQLQAKTESFLDALVKYDVCSRKALVERWKIEPDYLLREYCEWIPLAAIPQVQAVWPPA